MEINILIAKNDLSIKHKTGQPHLKRIISTIFNVIYKRKQGIKKHILFTQFTENQYK